MNKGVVCSYEAPQVEVIEVGILFHFVIPLDHVFQVQKQI